MDNKIKNLEELFIRLEIQESINRKAIRASKKAMEKLIKKIFKEKE